MSRPRWEGEGKPTLEWITEHADELAAWFESDAYLECLVKFRADGDDGYRFDLAAVVEELERDK